MTAPNQNPFELFKLSFTKSYSGFSDQSLHFLYKKYGTAVEAYKYIGWINVYPAGVLIRDHAEGRIDIKEWLSHWEWYEILDNEIIVKKKWYPDPGI